MERMVGIALIVLLLSCDNNYITSVRQWLHIGEVETTL